VDRKQEAADDLEFARRIVRDAHAAGADHAQVLTSVTDKVEVVWDSMRNASMRNVSLQNSSLLVIAGGRPGSVSFSDVSAGSVTEAVSEALHKATIAMPIKGFRLAEGVTSMSSNYGEAMPDKRRMVDLAVDYSETMRREYPEVVTRESSNHHSLVRTTFCNSNGVTQQEVRGIYGFSTLFAARGGGRTTSFASYGVNSLTPFERIIDQGDQHRRYEDAMRCLDARVLHVKFTGAIIVAPEALGFIVAPLLKDISASVRSKRAALSGDCDEIASSAFSLSNRPHGRSLAMGRDFDGYGVPTQNIDFIVAGRLQVPLVDFMAASLHGLTQNFGWTSAVVHGSEHKLSELIAATDRGIIFSTFSGSTYRDLEFSGAVRNSFYIENGKITCAIDDVMISGNIRDLLRNVSGVSMETVHSGTAIFPHLAARGVAIQSGTGRKVIAGHHQPN
jgi:PmbA protein